MNIVVRRSNRGNHTPSHDSHRNSLKEGSERPCWIGTIPRFDEARETFSNPFIMNPRDSTGCPKFSPPHRERSRLYKHIRREIVDYVSLVREGGVSPATSSCFRTSRTRINGWSHRVSFLEDSVSAGLPIMHSLVCAAVPYSWNQST